MRATRVLSAAVFLSLAATSSRRAGAQRADSAAGSCDSVSSRTTLGALSGAHISSLDITPLPPAALRGAAARLSILHVTTQQSVIRRDLRFAVHDTVDSIAIGESMRRLRSRNYIANSEITATRCANASDVRLRVITDDKWSLNPSLAVQASSSYGGVEERNLFGTGRAASVSLASRQGKFGGALGYTDPYLLNLPVFMRLRVAEFGDGDEIRGRFRNAEQDPRDMWRAQLTFARYRRNTGRVEPFGGYPVLVSQAFRREGAFLLFGRRIGEASTSANSILFGADLERASLNAPDDAPTVGPKLVERRYHGPTVGFARRAVTFDTVGWLAERQLLVDVPLGFEMEGLVSAGHEDITRGPAAFGSAWIGKMWVPSRSRLAALDFWTSGYRISGRKNFDAASARTLFSYYRRDGGALYSLHAAAEKLVNPDPDVRALEILDPTIQLIPQPYRLSENAFAATLERARHVRPLIRSVSLDGALFVAGSYRTASALSPRDHFGVTAVGAGLRLVPTAAGSGSLRLDAMFPVLKSRGTRSGFTLAVSVTPWLQSNRQRDDPRLRQ